jgi:excinuclease ABC subunit A
MKDRIVVRGARQHNLKGFDLEIPRRSFTVVTGPSGSGKSSLAFDTIYAEGQRRYVESLSAYARQFLERMEKPAVDHIDGLSPAVAIEQKNPTRTSRSTVGTATEIYDYLRLLWARVGPRICPKCGRELKPDTVQSVTDTVLALPGGHRFYVAAPLKLSDEVTHEVVIENLRAQGFVRVASTGRQAPRRALVENVDVTFARELLVVVDRLVINDEARGRLADALAPPSARATATPSSSSPRRSARRSTAIPSRGSLHRALRVPQRRHHAARPTPQLFSFNSPRGACPQCNGFGAVLEYDEALIVPTPSVRSATGAIDPWTKPRYDNKRRALADYARGRGSRWTSPSSSSASAQRHKLLHASVRGYKGICPSCATSRRSATSSTSASSCGSIRRRRSAPRATARSSSPSRSR